jgi:hypothetical protein
MLEAMPPARSQPLTWLFLLATACLDGALVKAGLYSLGDGWDEAAVGLLVGQMFAAGCWVAGGTMHRLARGGLFVGAVLALTTIIAVATGDDRARIAAEWGRILAIVIIFSGIAAAAATVGTFLVWRARIRRQPSSAVRYRLVEVFGWMIVVAVASAAVRFSDFGQVAGPNGEHLYMIASSAVAGAAYALLLAGGERFTVARFAASLAVVVTFLTAMRIADPNRGMFVSLCWAYVYLAAWWVVMGLDRSVVMSLRLAPPPELDGELPAAASPFDRRVDDEAP